MYILPNNQTRAVDQVKVIHPKFYKHLKEVAQDSHLGTQKMSWFLADRLVHQVKPEILNNIAIYNLILNFQFD